VEVVTPAKRWRNVLLAAEGCYLLEDEASVRPGSAISSGVEEDDATQDITGGPGKSAPLSWART
jgi:hypothetical protein